MTILASDIINTEFLDKLAQVSDIANASRDHLSFTQWMLEHRTASIHLPRRTHKTSTLLRFSNDSTLVVFSTQQMLSYARREFSHVAYSMLTIAGLTRLAESSVPSVAPKISRIFTDELGHISASRSRDFWEAIEMLHKRNLLTDDCFILNIGTPVR